MSNRDKEPVAFLAACLALAVVGLLVILAASEIKSDPTPLSASELASTTEVNNMPEMVPSDPYLEDRQSPKRAVRNLKCDFPKMIDLTDLVSVVCEAPAGSPKPQIEVNGRRYARIYDLRESDFGFGDDELGCPDKATCFEVLFMAIEPTPKGVKPKITAKVKIGAKTYRWNGAYQVSDELPCDPFFEECDDASYEDPYGEATFN